MAVVSSSLGASAPTGPVGVEERTPLPIDALVFVGAEVVSLGLKQVGWQSLAAVAVVIR